MDRRTRTALAAGLTLGVLGAAGCSPSNGGEPGNGGGETGTPADGFVAEGTIPNNLGENLHHELEIDAVERTEGATAVHLTMTNQGEKVDRVNYRGATPVLFDPVGGELYWPLIDGEPTDSGATRYGSDTDGDVPFFEGVHNELRLYYPAVPEDVDTVTFFGFGVGAMPGIPVTHVDEHRPEPDLAVDGTEVEELDSDPEPGATLTRPLREPDGDAQEHVLDTHGYVEGADASLTREGDDETVALDADVLFEFDESDLTEEAGEVLADTGETIRRNAAPGGGGTLVITGHTDGVGDDDYNQELSQRRAKVVAEELEPELGDDFDAEVSGKGSDEPVAEEGGDDDEEARRANRRVEISYEAAAPSAEDAEGGRSALAAAERHVGEPARFRPFEEPVATREHDGFQLDVFPLRRDGAHVLAVLDVTNTGEEKAMPDLGGDEALRGGGGRSESLGGVRLVEPDEGLTRYPLVLSHGDEYQDFAEHTFNVGGGDTRRLFAVYPAPSPDAGGLTLTAGPFGEFTELEIE
ncbi:OmpA family protein [Halostreptopolyspora alba]|uniref:OmpA family protein n=1 Tax=Halostreptopolyspora alba TaxID=2487137 RepID=A0A3N0E533_9ACTN|nr:OmpA family protein [Nocardiopsaceae bacterium YIM 96095]